MKHAILMIFVTLMISMSIWYASEKYSTSIAESKTQSQQLELQKSKVKDLESELLKCSSIMNVYNDTIDKQEIRISKLNTTIKKLDKTTKKFISKNRGKFRTIKVRTTAYTFTGNRTFTGTVPSVGQVAVDPKVIPLGSKMYIDGYGFAIATDTGDKWIQGKQIDLFMNTKKQCIKYGLRHNVKVIILK